MDIFYVFKKLFSSGGATAAQTPTLDAEGPDREAYELWKRTVWQQNLRQWLLKQYQSYAQGSQAVDGAVHFLCCKITKGFTWQFDGDRWSAQDFRFMFAYLREQAQRLGYTETRLEKSPDACSGSRGNFFHRSMLRPQTDNQDNRFGDILVCLAEQDGQVHSVKFSATSCREPDCACDARFGELVRKLLQ
jgi:hypothetical protein